MKHMVALGALIALVAACLGAALSTQVVRCGGALVRVAEPTGWRDWPPIPRGDEPRRLFGFGFRSEPMLGPKYGIGHVGAELFDPGLCPGTGVSLADWFETGDAPWIHGIAELSMHHDAATGVHVVTGHTIHGKDPGPERFVVAFRRDLGERLAFRTRGSLALLTMLACMLVAGGTSLTVAVRKQRASRPEAARRAARAGFWIIMAVFGVMACAVTVDTCQEGLKGLSAIGAPSAPAAGARLAYDRLAMTARATEQCPPGTEPDAGTGMIGGLACVVAGIAVMVVMLRWAARSERPRWPKVLAGFVLLIGSVVTGLWWLVSRILTCVRP
jgi:hypothetical protein